MTLYPDMTDLLAAADLLVTDYSSSLFDFSLTGRPMVLWAYDLDDYRERQRGLYLDPHTDLPGPVVATGQEVGAHLAARDRLPPPATRRTTPSCAGSLPGTTVTPPNGWWAPSSADPLRSGP